MGFICHLETDVRDIVLPVGGGEFEQNIANRIGLPAVSTESLAWLFQPSFSLELSFHLLKLAPLYFCFSQPYIMDY